MLDSLLALSFSLYNTYTALTDYRILTTLDLNSARKALANMHLRVCFSRSLYSTMYLLVGIIAFFLVPRSDIQAPGIIILTLLNAVSLLAVVNFILEKRDRTIILEEDAKMREYIKQITPK